MGDARADHRQAVYAYEAAKSEAEVARARAEIDGHFARAERLRTTRRLALGAAAAVYVAGAAHALLHHVLRPGLRTSAPQLPPVTVHARDAGFSLVIQF